LFQISRAPTATTTKHVSKRARVNQRLAAASLAWSRCFSVKFHRVRPSLSFFRPSPIRRRFL